MNDFFEWLNEAQTQAHRVLGFAAICITVVAVWLGFMVWLLVGGKIVAFVLVAFVPTCLAAVVLLHDWRSDRRISRGRR